MGSLCKLTAVRYPPHVPNVIKIPFDRFPRISVLTLFWVCAEFYALCHLLLFQTPISRVKFMVVIYLRSLIVGFCDFYNSGVNSFQWGTSFKTKTPYRSNKTMEFMDGKLRWIIEPCILVKGSINVSISRMTFEAKVWIGYDAIIRERLDCQFWIPRHSRLRSVLQTLVVWLDGRPLEIFWMLLMWSTWRTSVMWTLS